MQHETLQIRISDVIHVLFKRKWMILILTVIGLAVGIVLSIVSYMRGEMSKQYAITSSFAVTSVTEDGLFTTQTNNPNSNDIYLAENMVDSVMYVVKSDKMLNTAIDKLNLVGISTKDINSNLSLKQYNETQIVEMTLYWRSAEEGVQILTALNEVAPEILINTLKIGGVSVVNEPKSRYIIGGNMNASMWVYMAVLGMMMGCGISVLELLVKPTLINVQDVEKVFDLEVIEEIPQSARITSQRKIPLGDEAGETDAMLNEYFISAAHVLRNRMKEADQHRIFITSAAPGEGKSTVAANLALQLAELEHKVLLIDLDMRNPSLSGFFLDKVEYRHSLNALYHGDAEKTDVIAHVTGWLDVIPTILEEHIMPLDEALLALIQDAMEGYDYVIMDTSPVGRAADTMNLNRIAESSLFVIRYDTVSISDIRQALERMEKAGISMIGCIVNSVKKAADTSYYGKKKMPKTKRQIHVAQTVLPSAKVEMQNQADEAGDREASKTEDEQPTELVINKEASVEDEASVSVDIAEEPQQPEQEEEDDQTEETPVQQEEVSAESETEVAPLVLMSDEEQEDPEEDEAERDMPPLDDESLRILAGLGGTSELYMAESNKKDESFWDVLPETKKEKKKNDSKDKKGKKSGKKKKS